MNIAGKKIRHAWLIRRLLFWTAVALIPACSGDARPGSRLDATRVLGARVQTVADSTQVWPRPGESFRVTWLVAGPAAPRPLAWAFRATACAANQDAVACRAGGVPVAATTGGGVSGSSPGGLPPAGLPALELTVPDAATVFARAITKIIVEGVLCGGGAVGDLDAPAWARCAATPTDDGDTVDETDVEATVVVRLGDDGNHAPTVGDDALSFGGQPWTAGAGDAPSAGGGGACADAPEAPMVAARRDDDDDQTHAVVLVTDATDRETHPVSMPAPGAPATEREALQLSAFATAGSFESQFGAVENADAAPAPAITVDWTPPTTKDLSVPDGGRLVRFVFVLRDLRGGIDWATRTVCLTPPRAP